MENAIVKSISTPLAETKTDIQQMLNGLRQLIETTKQQVLLCIDTYDICIKTL